MSVFFKVTAVISKCGVMIHSILNNGVWKIDFVYINGGRLWNIDLTSELVITWYVDGFQNCQKI